MTKGTLYRAGGDGFERQTSWLRYFYPRLPACRWTYFDNDFKCYISFYVEITYTGSLGNIFHP